MKANPNNRRFLPWLAYPGVMLIGISSYHALGFLGFSLQLSSYLAAVVAGGMIIWLEHFAPHYQEWQGKLSDARVDLAYMLLVQIALPVLLAVSVSVAALDLLAGAGWTVAGLWPHHWPVVAQVITMLLVADFLRYWLHVAAHRYGPLWRLHAVHHSVDKLYWLNVGRFHPLEKALQYVFDALPFILMQVSPEVLTLYFVFYSINGFFQHSNVELRFGWLNYIISSAELHRWHHSRLVGESNANYGNNLIVWDLLFGTRFLPRDRLVSDLGLPNRKYPMGFLAQLKTPFIRGVEKRDSATLSWMELLLNGLLWLRMKRLQMTSWQKFKAASQNPQQIQQSLLRRILSANQATQFGIDHGFAGIASIQDYQDRVPVQDYETLRPYIERHMEEGGAELTSEPPVMYARTSGTTGKAKFVPLLRSALEQHRRAQALFSVAQFKSLPEAYYGRVLGIVSPAIEGHLDNGVPYGSASGHVYKNMPRLARAKYVIPWQVFEVSDYDLKYLLILRLAMAHQNVTYLGSANPSTFLKLLETARSHRDELMADIEAQTFTRISELPAGVADAIRPRLGCIEARRRELARILHQADFGLGDLWPYLRLVSTWTGGSCGIALDAVRSGLPEDVRVADLGYMASEFRGSVTVDIESNAGVPTLTENFFEFVKRSEWEQGEQRFRTLEQLQPDCEYYVFVTTPSGLYRYHINDIIRTTGWFGETPTIEFVQKGRGVTSITGEKLAESQVMSAVGAVLSQLSVNARNYVVLADAAESRYLLLLESESPVDGPALAEKLDRELGGLNLEYHEKRASNRLAPLACKIMRSGFSEACKLRAIADGQREGQYKTQVLQYRADFEFEWEEWAQVTR